MMTTKNSLTGTSEAGAVDRGPARRSKTFSCWSRCQHSLSALTLAIMAMGLPLSAQALSLGKAQVMSALGEPMSAEIDIADITDSEAASLSVTIAPPDAFKALGIEYSGVLPTVQVSVQRRANGRSYIRLNSGRVINDPFVDLILEVNWSTGRLVRDYTLLFDPRNLMPAATVSPQLPVAGTAPATAPSPAAATPSSPLSSAASAPAPIKATVSAAPAHAPVNSPRPAASSSVSAKVGPSGTPSAPATAPGKTTVVREGDTAGSIAKRHKTAQVSLDQMLAAMLRSNPEAFIKGDINRIKAGAVIDTPSAQDAAQINPEEARQTLVASSRDFAQYRQRAAQLASTQDTGKPARQSSGQVEARVVEDKKSGVTSPDKLKLAKGSVQGTQTAASIAQSRQTADQRERSAELGKNIAELNKASAAAAVAASPTNKPAVPSVAPAAPVAAPALAASAPATAAKPAASAAAPVASVSASAAASAAQPTASAAETAASAAASAAAPTPVQAPPKATPPKAPAPPPPEPGFLDALTENPLVPAGAAGLIAALLGGFAFWKRRQANRQQHVDSSFLESRLQPDSFFGASGGQMVNTEEGAAATGSSMIYSPSQLDAAGDVDPVAEAEVYIAYGRDLQAEEILKEALRTQGSRVAVHVKLLEIYAKRRDAKAFELVAREVYDLTSGDGTDWEHVCNLGRMLDPASPLYQPGGKPSDLAGSSIADVGVGAASFAASTMPHHLDEEEAASAQSATPEIDLDLDLDIFSDAPAPAPEGNAMDFDIEPTIAMNAIPASADPAPDLSLNLDASSAPTLPAAAPEPAEPGAPLEFSLDDFPAAPAPMQAAPAPAAEDPHALSFDLGSLSLDLPSAEAPAQQEESEEEDPMNTKLELATEFYALGDIDGARAIAEEVATEASGGLKTKAQKLLSQWT